MYSAVYLAQLVQLYLTIYSTAVLYDFMSQVICVTGIYPHMFAKTMFVLKDGRILHLHTPEMSHDASRGRPESIAPEFLSWRRTEVKLSPPKVAESWKLVRFFLL